MAEHIDLTADNVEKDTVRNKRKVMAFMHTSIYPNEKLFHEQSEHSGLSGNEWTHAPILVELKRKAKALGLWNMFLPVDSAAVASTNLGAGLTNRQYVNLDLLKILEPPVPARFTHLKQLTVPLVLILAIWKFLHVMEQVFSLFKNLKAIIRTLQYQSLCICYVYNYLIYVITFF